MGVTTLAGGKVPGHINRIGLVPKRQRLRFNLSFPKGTSVNDGIEREFCTIQYSSVDDACKKLIALGRGAQLAKFDVQGASRTVPVHGYSHVGAPGQRHS